MSGVHPVQTVARLTATEHGAGVMTRETAVQETANRLKTAGFHNARQEARRLITQVLDLETSALIAAGDCPLSLAERARLTDAIDRRSAGEPLSRIVGHRAFFGRSFQIGPDTLDPRPDTECVVELALDLLDERARERQREDGQRLRILDIGTGTGCIAITLACERTSVGGVATDIAPGALAIAERNAQAHGVADRLTFVETSGCEGLTGPFDLVISNPPYIRSALINELEPEVSDHDPRRALDGGPDGLLFYRAWLPQIARIAPHAAVVLEVGCEDPEAGAAGEAAQVEALLKSHFSGRSIQKMDLSGHTRSVAISPVNP